jgi:RND family efflux transporter MFP subunit
MNAQNTFFLAALLSLMTACGGPNDIEKKKEKLAELRKQQSELKAEISVLEKELKDAGYNDGANVKVKDVQILTVQPKEFKHYIEVQGRVDSDNNVAVSAKAAGTITRVFVKTGDFVKAGTVLATIDDEAMRKGVQELQANLDLVKTVYEKQKSLWEQKIGTEVQYLQAKTNYESLVKRKEQLNEQLDAYRVKATVEGTIDEIFPNVGELVSPGMPVARIVSTTGLKVMADIAEGYSNKVHKGNKASIYFPNIEYTMDTHVKVVSNMINPVNRTFAIEFDLKNAPKNIKANMLAYVKVLDYNKPSSIVVPVNVVQHSETADFVYVVKNNKAVKTEIKTGAVYRTDAEVLSGLQEGDQVIVVGYQDVVDGQVVKF